MHLQPLSEELQEKARKELNEVPSKTEETINLLKEWLKKQPHLNSRTDDLWLLNFLRSCKFSLQRTKEKLEEFYTARSLIPEIFDNRDPLQPEIQYILDHNFMIPLETDNSVDLIIRWEDIDFKEASFLTLLKVGFMFFDLFLYENNICMITSQHIVDDLKGFSLNHLQQCTPTVLKKLLMTVQNGYPMRIKGFHCINAPSHVKPIVAVCKPILNKKMQNRIHIYAEGEFKKLHSYVPQSAIPKEYGGNGGSIREIGAKWKKKIESSRDWFLEDAQYRCDESKRPEKRKTSADVFGIEGSFRKLDID